MNHTFTTSKKSSLPEFPLVSIITIVLNGEKHIRTSIESVINQSYSNIEYIVIDGGSTDNTINIIKEYENKINYWCSEKDKGISDAFNKGIEKATGEIIGIINADDWYEKTAIEKTIIAFNKADVIYGNVLYWKADKKTYLFKANHRLLKLEMSLNHPAVFVKRKTYDQFGKFDLQYKQAMDYDLMLRLLQQNVSFYYLDDHLANMSLSGVSDKNWIKGCKEVLKIKNTILGHKLMHYVWFLKQLFIIFFSKFLNRVGLATFVAFYRKYSPVKKIAHETK